MDSLTQIVLGAAVGEAVAGKKLGNKALLWGAIAGTIPDLDVLANPLLDMVEQLSFHRSITHSFLFALLVSPLLGGVLWRFNQKEDATFRDWSLLFFLGFTTHAILDSFTTWGTQLLWPFTNYGVAFYNIFVIDPLYTLPFLICVVAVAFYDRRSRERKIWNRVGLIISSLYLAFSFAAQAYAKTAFEQGMKQQDIAYRSHIVKATPLNTLLWSITAETEEGFYTGFYSILDPDKNIPFNFEPHQAHLLEPYRGDQKLERLLDITKGYYVVEKADRGYYINDLRFGQFDGWREGKGHYVFVYHMWTSDEGTLQFEEINNRPKIDSAYLQSYLNRILGGK
ncbi:metal-dependent hydrolase [Pontibacter sp. JH31]|uniref:Metal-dependent hydrolase n=1 Tax=Pontibacter aquaedesilientis TaxID=2766980 RepID=A0ABR7XCV0_9BACT|nr:metal-dependent hydrolase [Pontibacter aquaedesilientis]MBD1396120.1 metal-dependent hydrolase [Pontibacter aquaedesilientis]